MDTAAKKSTGSYYTCGPIADYVTKWAIDSPESCVLEPSFGDGIFMDAAIARFAELGNANPDITGVEIQAEPYNSYMSKNTGIAGFCMDFLDYRSTAKINAIVGNPPYVRLKNLKPAEKEKALAVARSCDVDMQTSGSLWMPFVIHATELLARNGKLGFVLPYEITYVRYAFGLWNYLSRNYGKITICRIFQDFFPDVNVEAIVFLAEKKGMSTNVVEYNVFETIEDLCENNICHTSPISIEDIVRSEKPCERVLIPKPAADYLDTLRRQNKLTKFVRDCKFRAGYVSGNKGFFQPSKGTISQFGIQQENLRKSLLNAKQLSANTDTGLATQGAVNYSFLFYPEKIENGENNYIRHGEAQGVHRGYKCRVRNPWYLTPGLEIPDIVLTVFGDIPKLLLNNGRFYASSSLLCGFSKIQNPKELICRWYNSLTLLSIETVIHSLGGGTLNFSPGETDKLEVISDFPADEIETTYEKLSSFAHNNRIEDVYTYGDSIVLKKIYGFSDETINNIRTALSLLRSWRNPAKRKNCLKTSFIP